MVLTLKKEPWGQSATRSHCFLTKLDLISRFAKIRNSRFSYYNSTVVTRHILWYCCFDTFKNCWCVRAARVNHHQPQTSYLRILCLIWKLGLDIFSLASVSKACKVIDLISTIAISNWIIGTVARRDDRSITWSWNDRSFPTLQINSKNIWSHHIESRIDFMNSLQSRCEKRIQ